MRVLLIHPEDDPDDDQPEGDPSSGLLSHSRWDRKIGIGTMSGDAHGATVEGLPRLDAEDFILIRQALAAGSGSLIDAYGLDWWELMSIEFHQQLERLRVLRHVARTLAPSDEVFVSRPCLDARMLEAILGRKLRDCARPETGAPRLARRLRTAFKFQPRQLAEILGDKYDGGYRLRRLISRMPARSSRPVVLVPSSYVNVSRGASAYASAVPDLDFLLVTTRASGRMREVPPNVRCATLASYAAASANAAEREGLMESWRALEKRLALRSNSDSRSDSSSGSNDEWAVLAQLGGLSGVAPMLRSGLAVRDAWMRVFEAVPVQSVLCGDEMNPFTRLPVLIAKARGISTLAFHHGALDGRYRYRDNSADVMLAKGQMEADYLTNVCGLGEERVEIAPAPSLVRQRSAGAGRAIVFFSESYEVAGGRCRNVYREVLPRLAKLASDRGCELVLKLHPQESFRERSKLAASVVRQQVRIVEGPLTSELLQQAWFAVTVSSTAAVDCAIAGIPAFLCRWLDQSAYQYGAQFVKFGAALPLNAAAEISALPERLLNFQRERSGSFCGEVDAAQLRRLLKGDASVPAAPEVIAEKAWA